MYAALILRSTASPDRVASREAVANAHRHREGDKDDPQPRAGSREPVDPVLEDARGEAPEQPGVHRDECHEQERDVQVDEQRVQDPHGS